MSTLFFASLGAGLYLFSGKASGSYGDETEYKLSEEEQDVVQEFFPEEDSGLESLGIECKK